MRRILVVLLIVVMCVLVVDFARFTVKRALVAHAAYLRARTHLIALQAFAKEHGEFPGVLLSAESRSEFLCYAGDRFDSPTKQVTSPQYIFPLYNENSEWLASPTGGKKQNAAVFVKLLQGVPGNSVIIIRQSGPRLRNEQRDQDVSLQNAELILYSGESRLVPKTLSPSETSQFILNLNSELNLNNDSSPTQA